MKKILIGLATVASLLTTGAYAADLSRPVYSKAPVMVDPIFSWTGFYVGGNVGYSWGRSSDTSTFTNGAGTLLFATADNSNLNGVVGGGQVGYNWQMQNWLFGLEGDIQGSNEKGSRDISCPIGICTPGAIILVAPGPAVPATLNQKIDWFGTVRGRIGFLPVPQVLLYGTGGLAYGQINSSEVIAGVPSLSSSATNVGYTVGAGVEGAIGGNWTARLEYLYVDLGKVSGSFATPIPALGGGTITTSYNSRVTDNIVRVGINYLFH